MRGFHSNSFDPQTLIVLEAAFDEAWLTLKAIGNTTVKPDELARSVLRLAMEGRARSGGVARRRAQGIDPGRVLARKRDSYDPVFRDGQPRCAKAATIAPAIVPANIASKNGSRFT
jgi:hypothetical protein